MKRSTLPLYVALLAASSPAVANETDELAPSGMIEVSAGHKASTLDTKLTLPITPAIAFFTRNRLSLGYEGKPDFFTVGSVSCQLTDGFAASAELDVTPQSVDSRLALEYFRQFGPLDLYGMVSGSPADANLLFFLDARFNPDGSPAALGLEAITIVGNGGHQLSLQRGRAGVRVGNSQLGVFADLTEAGTNMETSHNLGAYLRTLF